MKRFLLVDDHIVVRSGMKSILIEIFNPAEIHEAGDGNGTIEKLKQHTYDLIMMDIQMPNTDTLGLMKIIHQDYPAARVLIFSMSAENIYAKRFMKAGAYGFISKESPLEEITRAINLILNDRKYISDSLIDKLAEDSLTGNRGNPFDKLSPKEFEIASLLLSGKTLTDISHTLNIHTSTVGTHKARLFEKLGVTNVLELNELAKVYGVQ